MRVRGHLAVTISSDSAVVRSLAGGKLPAAARATSSRQLKTRRAGRPAREQHPRSHRSGARRVADRGRPRRRLDAGHWRALGAGVARRALTVERRGALGRAAGQRARRWRRMRSPAPRACCRSTWPRPAPPALGVAGHLGDADRRSAASRSPSSSGPSVPACTTPTSAPCPPGIYRFALTTQGSVTQNCQREVAIPLSGRVLAGDRRGLAAGSARGADRRARAGGPIRSGAIATCDPFARAALGAPCARALLRRGGVANASGAATTAGRSADAGCSGRARCQQDSVRALSSSSSSASTDVDAAT